MAGTYTITTTGFPAPTLALVVPGSSPTGMTFTDNGNGTGTIAGTPTTAGTYPVSISATNISGSTSTLDLTITVGSAGAPTITSPATADFTLGQNGAVAITTAGSPVPAITETGTLPAGLTFTDEGTGTALLQGTPTAISTSSFNVSASNGISPDATQTFTVVVGQTPTFTSAATTSFGVASAGTFAVTATGYPAPSLGVVGTLPTGVTFVDDGGGTGILAGTSSVAAGTYTFTIAAANGTDTTNQSFTLSVGQAQAISFTASASGAVGGSATLSATGGASGSPVVFTVDSTSGTGVCNVSGTDGTTVNYTAAGSCVIDANQAGNSSYSAAPQVQQTVTVGQGSQTISFTGPTSGTVGSSATLSATGGASGNPVVFSVDSSTATGVCNVSGANGTTLNVTGAGTCVIDANQAGNTSYSAAPPVTWSVTVVQGPTFMSVATDTVPAGSAFSFTVMATGGTAPIIALQPGSSLPAGVTLTDPATSGTTSTATLAGTSSVPAGVYSFTISTTNGSGTTTQAFTLTVTSAPAFTSLASTAFTVGQPPAFTVMATGTPTPTLSETGSLPPGVTFTANTNGTATLGGSLTSASEGNFPLTFSATSTAGKTSQSFTLTVVSGTLLFTSGASTTFAAGKARTFPVTATGTPTPTLTESGALPSGVTFVAGTAGTAALAGTPAATAKGIYPITFTATNTAGRTSQAFTLTVDQTPSFSSAAAVTETAGTAFGFTVSAIGYPTPALSTGTLPAGVSFSDNGNGTGSLSGTTAVAAGTYTLTVTAANAGGSTSQTITLTVKAAGVAEVVPTITSAAMYGATAGTAFSFTVTTSAPTTYTTNITHSGALPAGVSFSNNGKGTATVSGTPTTGSGGVYTITLTAKNTAGTTTQSFVLTVSAKPTITSAATSTATVGATYGFTVKTTGYPLPAFGETGALPAGVTFTDNGNGTATLAGTPNANSGGVYAITVSATNALGTTTQSFTLTVRQPPVITNANSAAAVHGTAFTFQFKATGYPLPTLTHTGTVAGLKWTDTGSGTATLSGTPRTAGTYTLPVTATNNNGTTTQTFTLTVS